MPHARTDKRECKGTLKKKIHPCDFSDYSFILLYSWSSVLVQPDLATKLFKIYIIWSDFFTL